MMDDAPLALQPVTSAERWREVLMGLPGPHPLQSWVWGAFKARWGWAAQPLVFQSGEQVRGAALVLKRRLAGPGLSILYVPKGPVLDYDDEALRRAVLAGLGRLARQERAIFVKIDPDVALSRGLEPEMPCPTGLAFREELWANGWRFSDDQVQFRNTVELSLLPTEEDLLAAMKQKTRYNIRLAGRRDVAVRDGGPADFPTIFGLYAETAARDGFAIRPRAYYLDGWQSFYNAGMADVLIAEFEGAALAAVISVRYANMAIYMYGASSEAERQRMPNYLLQWQAIRRAKAQGCAVYDLWGAPDVFDESDSLWGVWRFKAGLGGEVVRHIGAWDYVARPFWYWLHSVVVPRYLSILRVRSMISRLNDGGSP